MTVAVLTKPSIWIMGDRATHKIWRGSMQRFLRNLNLQTMDDGQTNDRCLRHNSSSADFNKRPTGLDALLKNQLGHRPKLHIHSLSQDVEIEHIFALWAAVSEIMAVFQNCHIWAWNLAIGQNSRSGTYTLFRTKGLEIELILALWAAVTEMLAKILDDFQKFHIWTGIPKVAHIVSLLKLGLFLLYGQRFPRYVPIFKIDIFGHETNSKWPKFQKLHMYAHSTEGGPNRDYFCSTGSGFQDTGQFSNLPYLGIKLGKWPKFQKLHIHPLSTPGGSKWSLFLLYGQRFLRYRPIFKIAIFGHESWQLAKVPKVACM